MSKAGSAVSRRTFMVASLLGGGGLLLGFATRSRAQTTAAPAPTPNAYIRIDSPAA